MPTIRDLTDTETYKKAGIMDRAAMREAFFKDFIATRSDFPKDPDTAKKIRKQFIADISYQEPLPPVPPLSPEKSAELDKQIQDEKQRRLNEPVLKAQRPPKATSIGAVVEQDMIDLYPKNKFVIGLTSALGQLDRPIGALRNLIVGKSPVEGFLRPAKTDPIGNMLVSKLGITDPKLAVPVSVVSSVVFELGANALVFGVVPKSIGSVSKSMKALYVSKQGAALNRLKNSIKVELVKSGIESTHASKIADVAVAKFWAQAPFSNKTISAINRVTNTFRANKGSVANVINDLTANIRTRKVLNPDLAKRLDFEPVKLIGRDQQQLLTYETIPMEGAVSIPPKEGQVVPSIKQITDQTRFANVNQPKQLTYQTIRLHEPPRPVAIELPPPKPTPIEKIVETPSAANDVLVNTHVNKPEVIAAAKKIQSYPSANVVVKPVKVSKSAIYEVQYHTLAGIKNVFMSGSEIDNLSIQIAKGIARDVRGVPITRLVDAFPINGKAGFVNIEPVADFIMDLGGKASIAYDEVKSALKNLGAPFFVADKYPVFKGVYKSVMDASRYRSRLFYAGNARLNPRMLKNMPLSSLDKVVGVLKVGNSTHSVYDTQQLKSLFKLNDLEVKAYQNIRRMYDYATNVNIEYRKVINGYYTKMDGVQKDAFDKKVVSEVKKLNGYLSQQRIEGDWVVYKEGDEFFNIYKNKSEASKAVKLLGGDARLYKKNKFKSYEKLTMHDLETLAEASGADTNAEELKLIRSYLMKKTFDTHWIKRKDVPGYDWSSHNVINSALDYLEGSVNRLARVTGKINAEKELINALDKMPRGLEKYARSYIDGFYNTGSIGFRSLNKLIYTWKLAFRTSFLAQNLTQPLATTYPLLARYYKGLNVEKAFVSAYVPTIKYMRHLIKGTPHGLSSDLSYYLNRLYKEGIIGAQITKLQVGAKGLNYTGIEGALGLFGTFSEKVNRTHAAIAGYRVAKDVLRLTRKEEILAFMVDSVNKTQFALGKVNLPTLITNAGSMKDVLRTAYTFRGFTTNQLQLYASMLPTRAQGSWSQALRTMGVSLAQSGIKGTIGYGLIDYAWRKIRGRTLTEDIRTLAKRKGVPDGVIDLGMHGVYSTTGIDATQLLGMGELIPTYGDALVNLAGAPAQMATDVVRGIKAYTEGDPRRASEYLTPSVIKSLIKTERIADEGFKVGNLKIATPTQLDLFWTGLGFRTMTESNALDAFEAKRTIKEKISRDRTIYARRIVRAMISKNTKLERKLREEARKKGIIVTAASIANARAGAKGVERRTPRRLRRRFREIDKTFGVRR